MDRFDCQILMATFANVYYFTFGRLVVCTIMCSCYHQQLLKIYTLFLPMIAGILVRTTCSQ